MNIDFFSSPAYRVPAMMIIRLAKLSAMTVVVRVPWRLGSAWNSGACRMLKFGAKPASSARSGRMNMFRTNEACHALGVT